MFGVPSGISVKCWRYRCNVKWWNVAQTQNKLVTLARSITLKRDVYNEVGNWTHTVTKRPLHVQRRSPLYNTVDLVVDDVGDQCPSVIPVYMSAGINLICRWCVVCSLLCIMLSIEVMFRGGMYRLENVMC